MKGRRILVKRAIAGITTGLHGATVSYKRTGWDRAHLLRPCAATFDDAVRAAIRFATVLGDRELTIIRDGDVVQHLTRKENGEWT